VEDKEEEVEAQETSSGRLYAKAFQGKCRDLLKGLYLAWASGDGLAN
jgi:hypothetical protein